MNPIQELYQRIEEQSLWEKSIRLKRNEYLKTSGRVDTHLYYIESGSLKVYMVNNEEEHIIRLGYKENFIIDIGSFITEKPSEFSIQALKDTTLKGISKKRYLHFINAHQDNRVLWDGLINQIILQQIEREKDILIRSPKERYQRVLKRSPHLFQEIPHKHIASYLRMSPETLSRLQKS